MTAAPIENLNPRSVVSSGDGFADISPRSPHQTDIKLSGKAPIHDLDPPQERQVAILGKPFLR